MSKSRFFFQKMVSFIFILSIFTFFYSQQGYVGINTTLPNATLDINISSSNLLTATNEGLLIPRIDRARAFSMPSPTNSTLVYIDNISTGSLSGSTKFMDSIGFYYYESGYWVKIIGGSGNFWNILGNNSTTPNTNFIGTTDKKDLVFKINNQQSGWLSGDWVNPSRNTSLGYLSLPLNNNNTNNNNTAFGYKTLASNISGFSNVAIGSYALSGITNVNSSTAIGFSALSSTSLTGANNTAVGSGALMANTSGNYNVAVGSFALNSNTSASNNNAFGTNALKSNITGSNNQAFGYSSLASNTIGSNNVAIGTSVSNKITSGNDNVAIGTFTNGANTTGNGNIAIGTSVMTAYGQSGTFAFNYNTAIGHWSLDYLYSGNENTAYGAYAGHSLTSGSGNVILGTYTSNASKSNVTTGNNNISLGYQSMIASPTSDNQLVIGNLIYGVGLDGRDNTISTGKIGIGTKSPVEKLEVDGNIKLSVINNSIIDGVTSCNNLGTITFNTDGNFYGCSGTSSPGLWKKLTN